MTDLIFVPRNFVRLHDTPEGDVVWQYADESEIRVEKADLLRVTHDEAYQECCSAPRTQR